MMGCTVTNRRGGAGLGLSVGLLLAFGAIATPGLSAESNDQPQDPGREMAESAGCDLSKNDVAMNVGTFDSYRSTDGTPLGYSTLEEAVLAMSASLKEGGAASFSTEDLKAAAAAATAVTDSAPIQVKLPGALISILRWEDGTYSVSEIVICA